jgi:hypothetical protein
LPLGLELTGTGWEEDVSTEGGVYTSPVLGSPNLRLQLQSRRRRCAPRLRPGDVDVQAEKGNAGVGACLWRIGGVGV